MNEFQTCREAVKHYGTLYAFYDAIIAGTAPPLSWELVNPLALEVYALRLELARHRALRYREATS